MSKAASSPTARILQNSRLFSLPRPLPQPSIELTIGGGLSRKSDTATLPYPTHQAIATPPSSHYRGDWGLKRALPARATKSSTPHIRVSAQDTPEHITDFGSAADHTQTEAKWREMAIPILTKQTKEYHRSSNAPVSAFDETLDNTTRRPGNQPRWKFDGPWIAGMQNGDFERFLRNLLTTRTADGTKGINGRSRMEEWRSFLTRHITQVRLADRRRQAQQAGETLSPKDIAKLETQLRPSDEDFRLFEKRLRDQFLSDGLSSELAELISTFLDLPGIGTNSAGANPLMSSVQTPQLRRILGRVVNDLEAGPPSTHASAGLSYLRTNAIMENHPIYGPQMHRAPFLARVLRPRNSQAQGKDHQATLGVAGIVTRDPVSATFNTQSRLRSAGVVHDPSKKQYDPDEMTAQLDEDLRGGNKLWVHPNFATIDETGHIRLEVTRADREATAVKIGAVEELQKARDTAIRRLA
ncbi:hypothetical protein M433DRAFT_261570 [Acidomyces richmondensis BFW]|nr:hypothetical protein M433DRAFT_261570 [Acidomyces richmondensis BFW]